MSDFTHTTLPAVGKTVSRLGLACSFGIDSDDVRHAFDRGVGYLFWTPRMKKTAPAVLEALKTRRDEVVLASGPTTAWWPGHVRSWVESTLPKLGTDHVDILQVHWAGVTASLSDAMLEELGRLRQEGKCLAIGCSIHDRPRAGRLAAERKLDNLMIRYNAAHPGAEVDIFPHLGEDGPSIVSYTATSWRKLLKAPRGWEEGPATAGQCYRFALSSPHVSVTLSGPKNRQQLDANLDALDQGPMEEEEMVWMRRFGSAVHG